MLKDFRFSKVYINVCPEVLQVLLKILQNLLENTFARAFFNRAAG